MRQKLIIVLLSVCATLLAVNLHVALRRNDTLPIALGQAVGTPTGQVALATVQGTSNEPWVFVYDVGSQQLMAYTNRGQGIELKGARKITWDLEIPDLTGKMATGRLTVQDIKNQVAKQKGGSGNTGSSKGKEAEKDKDPEEEEQ